VRRATLAVVGTMVGAVLLVGVKQPIFGGHSTMADGSLDPAGSGDPPDCASPSPSPVHRPSAAKSQRARPSKGATAGPDAGLGPRQDAGGTDEPMTFDGPAVEHRFGPVQVRIVVRGNRIIDIVALDLPADRTQAYEINGRAEPRLRAEALRTQSARIHTVSGATLTSEAYSESLQGAIDDAGIEPNCQ